MAGSRYVTKLMIAAQAELIKSEQQCREACRARVNWPTEHGVHRHGMGGYGFGRAQDAGPDQIHNFSSYQRKLCHAQNQ
jgi:hypothetical protein